MKLERPSTAGSLVFLVIGWVISAIPILMFGVGGAVMLVNPSPEMAKGMSDMGYPSHMGRTIVYLEIAFALLYAIPQTAILGAVLLTAFMGGAVATHMRVEDGLWFVPTIFGAIVWLGVYFRDARVRALLPLRR